MRNRTEYYYIPIAEETVLATEVPTKEGRICTLQVLRRDLGGTGT